MNKYEESKDIWIGWRGRQKVDPIEGFCNWEMHHDNFKLECWNVVDKGPVIFQFWPDGNGFHEYQTTGSTDDHEILEVLTKIRTMSSVFPVKFQGPLWDLINPAIEKLESK